VTRLYLDENVDGPVARGLRRRGVDVLTVQEDDRADARDPEVLDRATDLGRVLFTQDTDLLVEGARRQREGIPFAGVIYGPKYVELQGTYVNALELIALASEASEYANRVIYLPWP
jgi:predicted nuclease of predicted toxin-antitoxin system